MARGDPRRMERVVKHVQKMPYADRVWLMQRLTAVECSDIPVSKYLQVGWRDVVQTPRLGATLSKAQ